MSLGDWPLAALRAQLTPLLPGLVIEVLPTIDSSNTELMRRARKGALPPTLLIAEEQTAGRGRQGRSWYSGAGDVLAVSLGLPYTPRDWSGLSLAVGLSVAESLQPQLPARASQQPRIELKWPNDLWLADGRKLATQGLAQCHQPGAGAGVERGNAVAFLHGNLQRQAQQGNKENQPQRHPHAGFAPERLAACREHKTDLGVGLLLLGLTVIICSPPRSRP